MLDKILEIGAYADWITPFSAFLHNARYLFRVRTVHFPRDILNGAMPTYIPQGWTPSDMTLMLTDNGIENWGHQIIGNELEFKVRSRDYGRTIKLIQETVMNPAYMAPRHELGRFLRGFFQDRFGWVVWAAAIAAIVLLFATAGR